ncbi:MAG TPA: transporter substrate-binding domain-containing protein [Intrasporangium sp.]|uniref:substrate-binding periplasmic protein n=1 Tax=Intrasporangium sp. TaxID=1925024 RepID=UPI002D79AB58|nr:transporter substrate-binding domain-containing protein [Intrasporangium sp.]HET7397987.1 transporter substrate-binding domain-containing protein [Intrasporangium sp.]
MNITRRAVVGAAVPALLLTLGLSACGKSDTGSGSGSGGEGTKTLKIATSNDAPFSYKDPQGNLTGIDGEMINWIAKKKGWKLEVYTTDFATLIPSIGTKKADVVVDAMYITDERKKKVNFTDVWYTQGEGMVVPGSSTLAKRDDAKGKVIGAQTGTAFIELAKSLDPKEIKYFNSQAELLKAVENNQVDVAFTDAAVVAWSLKQKPNPKLKIVTPYTPYFPGLIGAAVRKEDSQLLADLNAGLKELKASPDYKAILEKYGLTEANAAK